MPRPSLLVIDDHASVLQLMESILGAAHHVTTVSDPAAAMALLGAQPFDVVITDVRMPGATGFDVLAAAGRADPAVPVVMMTGYATVPEAVTAIKGGAFDYVVKPLDADDVLLVVARAVAEREERRRAPQAGAGAGGARPPEERPRLVHDQFKDATIEARRRASREYLVALLTEFQGNVTHAAARAGMTRESLHRLLKKHDVKSAAFRPTG
jgi:DNA-binding NtrC family response regulator